MGIDERIEPKIGIKLIVAATPASKSGYLMWKISRPA